MSKHLPKKIRVEPAARQVRTGWIETAGWLVLAALLNTALVTGLVRTGVLQPLELAVYDRFLSFHRRDAHEDPRIALVAYSEKDIQRYGHPLSDEALARLLSALDGYGARVVGLDIFRDIPIPPGREALEGFFKEKPRKVVTIRLMGEGDGKGVPPPYMVGKENPVGFSDIVMDHGGVVRRGLLFLDDGERIYYSLSLLLALLYLEKEGIAPVADAESPDRLRLGSTTFRPLEPDDGGYVGADAGGYQFLLDFKGGRSPFAVFTIQEIFDGAAPPEALRDRAVLVGSTAESLGDFLFIPFKGGTVPGAVVHAHAVSQLLRSALEGDSPLRFLGDPLEWAWTLLWSLPGALLALKARALGLFATGALALTAAQTTVAYGLFTAGWWIPLIPPVLAATGTAGLVKAYLYYDESNQKAMLMGLFARHVSPDVAQSIWSHRDEFMNEGRPRPRKLTVTVMFTDFRNFTGISEALEPESLLDWLNECLQCMAQQVIDHQGVVNKYIGDSLMAVFGAPVARKDLEEVKEDAVKAVRCALAMSGEVERLNGMWKEKGLPPVSMRVGIATGEVVAGSIGSSRRLEYTVLGDTVNVASRLESFDKSFEAHNPCRILIGEETLRHLGADFETRPVGTVNLKGKSRPLKIFQILRERSQEEQAENHRFFLEKG